MFIEFNGFSDIQKIRRRYQNLVEITHSVCLKTMNKMCVSTFETKMFVKKLLFEKFEHVIWNKFRDRREGDVNKN